MLADDLPHLEEIDVDPSHGPRGLGTALVRALCDWATVSGYIMLTLTTFRAVPVLRAAGVRGDPLRDTTSRVGLRGIRGGASRPGPSYASRQGVSMRADCHS